MKSTKIILLEVLKWLFVAALCVFLYFMLSANRESRAVFSDVQEAVISAADLTPMAEGDNQTFKRLYGLSASDYENVLLYYPTTNMGAEELLLIQLKDLSQQQAVKDAIESRLDTQKKSFDGYGVDQYAMLEKAVVEVQGNYILLVVANDPAPVRKAFLGAL
ncbi:MAG: DUF4358 domain-containing protein [Oscillospiraceae bacterium]|nr:DUF4358 domain-containing protein [Oscillospiraceae bacterium]